MKNKLLIAFLCIGMLTAYYSCEKDVSYSEPQSIVKIRPEISGTIVETDSIFSNNHLIYNTLKQKFNRKGHTHSAKSIISDLYNFSIDTTRVQILSTDYIDSYTFVVNRSANNTDIIENYVLTVLNDSLYHQMLITYPYTMVEGERVFDMNNAFGQTIKDEDLLLSKSNTCSWSGDEIVAWDASAGECTDFPCSFPTGNGNHMPGQTCSATGTNRAFTQCTGAWVAVDCIDWSDGGNQGGGQGGSPNTGSDPSDNDNTTPIPEPEIPITPLEPTQIQDIIDCLVDFQIGGNNNSQALNLSLNSLSPENQAQIHSYLLLQNTCSDQAKSFVELAIEALDNDGVDDGVVDFELEMIVEINETLAFQNQTCLKAIKDAVVGTGKISKIIKKFEPTNPVLHLEWGIFNNPEQSCPK